MSDYDFETSKSDEVRKSIQADKRAMYFSDTRFVEQWMRAATQLINRWNQIENYLTE